MDPSAGFMLPKPVWSRLELLSSRHYGSFFLAMTMTLANAFGLSQASAQNEVTTDPVGFVKVTVPAQSDAAIAVPLHRAAVFQGMIESISGSTIIIKNSPGWTTNQFAISPPTQQVTYSVVIASGTKEGMHAKILANGDNSLTLALEEGESLDGVVSDSQNGQLDNDGDLVSIIPNWTLTTLFANPPSPGSQAFGYEGVGAGVNHSALQIYAFDGTNWIDGVFGTVANDNPLGFGASIIFRNRSTTAYQVLFTGAVPMTAHRSIFKTITANTSQDIRFGYFSPVPEALNDLEFPANAGDTIFGYDNSTTGYNKAASYIYSFDGAKWINGLTGQPIDESVKFHPGVGYLFRKRATTHAEAVTWQHVPSYLTP